MKNLKTSVLSFEVGDKDDAVSFLDRLAIENNWTLEFATMCFEEYKKFIYLSCISKLPITPSDEVDQVWHLHLSYTQSYWQALCQEILKKELHHCPTQGGQAEDAKYKRQYEYTLALYEKTFASKAPNAIWPSSQKRFQSLDNFSRISRSNYFLIKKPSKATVIPLLASLALVACSNTLSGTDISLALKWIFGIIFCYILINWIKSIFGGGGKGGSGGCSIGCGGGCGS